MTNSYTPGTVVAVSIGNGIRIVRIVSIDDDTFLGRNAFGSNWYRLDDITRTASEEDL